MLSKKSSNKITNENKETVEVKYKVFRYNNISDKPNIIIYENRDEIGDLREFKLSEIQAIIKTTTSKNGKIETNIYKVITYRNYIRD